MSMDKGYLSIGEVLSLLQDEFPDITISKIRFLESQGLIDPERTASGYRKFYEADLERLRFILREQKEHFLPLRVIKDRLDDGEIGAPATPVPSPNHPTQRVPVWMAEAKAKAKQPVNDSAFTPTADSAGGSPLLGPASGASFTFDELAQAAALQPSELADVERFGLVQGRKVGQATYYDEDCLVVARLAAGFLRHGLEARHLRMYRNSAERESSLYEQVILPLVKQRNPQARAQANATLTELAHLGERLRTAMLRQALKAYTENP
jgi:DNA-binding transcriptional MerR regulator